MSGCKRVLCPGRQRVQHVGAHAESGHDRFVKIGDGRGEQIAVFRFAEHCRQEPFDFFLRLVSEIVCAVLRIVGITGFFTAEIIYFKIIFLCVRNIANRQHASVFLRHK